MISGNPVRVVERGLGGPATRHAPGHDHRAVIRGLKIHS